MAYGEKSKPLFLYTYGSAKRILMLTGPSLNDRCESLFARLESEMEILGVTASRSAEGCRLLDFGAGDRVGTLEGGKLLARLCMGDLAEVSVGQSQLDNDWVLPEVVVQTSHPLMACMAGQFAGWPVAAEDWFGMGSGPARIRRGREPLFTRYGFSDESDKAWLVTESDSLPTAAAIRMIADECGVATSHLTVCVARTASLSGTFQVVARSIETTMHKLFELEFDLLKVVAAVGSAPLPPVGRDDLQAIGWTNDAILYGSRIWLCVDCDQAMVDAVLQKVPSSASADFGRPFREIFERYQRDFYAIDKMLFSPAQLTVHNLRSGVTRSAGRVRVDLLRESFHAVSSAK